MKKHVVIGLSGGVDSSVAAYILKEQGYRVSALFMRNWHDTTGLLQSECHWEDDMMFAEMVAKRLDIPFHFVDLSEPYRKRVVDYMFSEYEKGRTPNPDILCNREIKFDSFAEAARDIGAELVATGHYCRKDTIGTSGKEMIYRLLAGKDKNKDQSYFLCQISQNQLASALFPIGNLTKPEVRRIATEQSLPTAQRKDSQGICFVGKVDLPTFLQQKLDAKTGDIIEIDASDVPPLKLAEYPEADAQDEILSALCTPTPLSSERGRRIGFHRGAHFYTIGQRKGLNIGGYREPLFVVATDTSNNYVFVGEGHSHPALNRQGLFIRSDEIHYIRLDMEIRPGEVRDFLVRIRYRQALQEARLYRRDKGLYIIFRDLQRGITPGQFAAWYDGEELIGSGVIS